MLICMRTTLNLPAGLLPAAKARAARDGRTLTSLVEEGLRSVLRPAQDQPPVVLPVYGSGSGRQLIDLDDREALEDALDG